ncbi:nucleolar MIF4G domain-containing protein 1-like [Xenopus tropicalis]|uniref:Nucleolar MIF4G domain-containing protein 1-like n=2 Tax=Xenopus tropicalis TaxID=8364 RepID=A0A1B8XUM2_XENTR|nr:nucleolar MIF4G domain-containing protein 1-like [Xenopus tropicalis]XP_031757259.1 nucleolar MIF4G domain-containing protein 1-like [Xenopus tropicalis]
MVSRLFSCLPCRKMQKKVDDFEIVIQQFRSEMDRELKEIEGIYNEQLEELREAWIDSLTHLEERIDDILGVVNNMQALILEVKGKDQETPKEELTDESYETAMGSSSSSENTAEEQPKSSECSDISEGEEQEGSRSSETSEEGRMETSEGAEEKNTVKRVSFAENLCTEIPQWKHKKEGKFLRFFRRIFRKKSKKGGKKENTENCDERVKGSTTKRDVHFDANLSTYNDGTRQWKSTMLDHDEDLLQND